MPWGDKVDVEGFPKSPWLGLGGMECDGGCHSWRGPRLTGGITVGGVPSVTGVSWGVPSVTVWQG